MLRKAFIIAGAALWMFDGPAVAAEGPSDPEIAHIAYTAGSIDITAAKQALSMSHNKTVRDFAEAMVRDHNAVNEKALTLLNKLNVTPSDNAVSTALSSDAASKLQSLSVLQGRAFDKAYLQNEIAFHKTVNTALESTLIPAADNAELKALLETGLTLFREHQAHAEHVSAQLK